MTLTFTCAVVEVLAGDSVETDGEDFTFDSDAAPDVNEDYGKDFIGALAEDQHLSGEKHHAPSFLGHDQQVLALKRKLSHLDEYCQEALFVLLTTLIIVT